MLTSGRSPCRAAGLRHDPGILGEGRRAAVQSHRPRLLAGIANWNESPRPYVWVKTADQIIASLAHYCERVSPAATTGSELTAFITRVSGSGHQ